MATDFKKINPWALRPLASYVEDELKHRASEYGINPGDFKTYSGPRTAWMRVCSNGMVETNGRKKKGFVMGDVHGFNDTYGFDKSSITGKTNFTTLGYTAYGEPHEIENNEAAVFPHRPAPGIVGIETEFYGAGSSYPGLCRKATITWRCNSVDQLNYMFPYFLSPGVSIIVEWGWNNYNPSSLIDLTAVGTAASETSSGSGIIGMFTNSNLIYEQIEKSRGNYDCHLGKVFDYNFKMNSAGGYDCTTIVASSLFLLEGQSLGMSSVKKEGNVNSSMKSFRSFVENDLKNWANHGTNFKKKKNGEEDEDSIWVPMSRFAQLVNEQLSLNQSTSGTGAPAHGILRFDIDDTIITAHPLLKSSDVDVLIPNKYSPNLRPSMDIIKSVLDNITLAKKLKDKYGNTENLSAKALEGIQAASLDRKSVTRGRQENIAAISYDTLTPNVVNIEFAEFKDKFKELNVEFDYDDLNAVINYDRPIGHEFPRSKDLNVSGDTKHHSGYYGYLKDIYISEKMITQEANANDTTLKFIESVLMRISDAGSNIWEFRVIPEPIGNTKYSVIDNSYSGGIPKVPTFILGSIGSAHFTEMSMDVKMSQEMANQAILGQSKYQYHSSSPSTKPTYANGQIITSNGPQVSMFTSDDRLFGLAFSNVKIESVEDKFKKVMSRYNNKDAIISSENGKSHILTEHDPSMIKQLIKFGKKTLELASPMMPGTEMNLTTLGIGGIRYLDMFAVDKTHDAYTSKRAVWQIEGVKSVVEGNRWTTSIMARVRPIVITQ